MRRNKFSDNNILRLDTFICGFVGAPKLRHVAHGVPAGQYLVPAKIYLIFKMKTLRTQTQNPANWVRQSITL